VLLRGLALLSSRDWDRETECTGWTVRDMVAHLVGAAEGHASLPVFGRQYQWGFRHRRDFRGSSLDQMNQRQIQDQGEASGDELVRRLDAVVPLAVAGRARRARRLGWAPVSLEAAGSWYDRMPTRTTMGELCSVVLTRDVWAHRLDLAGALEQSPTLDPDVDGAIVEDIVADWAARHGQPYALALTGDAGGDLRSVEPAGPLAIDALDFARLMAGRRPQGEVPASPL
jgi:uncharacterized protein (TIGR03083 family)